MKEEICKQIHETCDFLSQYDPIFKEFTFSPEEIIISHDFTGNEYGEKTPEGTHAAQLLKNLESIQLDQTYTAKTVAALISYSQKLTPKSIILFWNTYDSKEIQFDPYYYKRLPKEFHVYFNSAS